MKVNTSGKLNHIQTGKEHYLFILSDSGKLQVFKPGGESVGNILPAYLPSSPLIYRPKDTSGFFIYGIDKGYNLTLTNLNKDWTIISHSIVQHIDTVSYLRATQAISGTEILFLGSDSNRFFVIDQAGKVLFRVNVPDTIDILPDIQKVPDGKVMITFTNRKQKTLNWYNLSGDHFPSLPMKGVTGFVIGNLLQDGRDYLLTGDEMNNLVLYKLK